MPIPKAYGIWNCTRIILGPLTIYLIRSISFGIHYFELRKKASHWITKGQIDCIMDFFD